MDKALAPFAKPAWAALAALTPLLLLASAAGGTSDPAPAPEVWASWIPDDPLYPEQWALPFLGVPEAWEIARASPVSIAVIDTGVGPHAELNPRLDYALGRDFVLHSVYNNSFQPKDWNGHGTHVAGIIAASLNNGTGTAGMVEATVVPVRVLSRSGNGDWEDLIAGIQHACAAGARVLSMSLGGLYMLPQELVALQGAIDACWESGAVMVAAAGNLGLPYALFPAALDHVLGVGAVDAAGQRPSWSNRGVEVDLYAPGVDVKSTCLIPDRAFEYHCAMMGTSMAVPHVSAVAALVWAVHPEWTNEQVVAHVLATADQPGTALDGWSPLWGHGILNAARAVGGG